MYRLRIETKISVPSSEESLLIVLITAIRQQCDIVQAPRHRHTFRVNRLETDKLKEEEVTVIPGMFSRFPGHSFPGIPLPRSSTKWERVE